MSTVLRTRPDSIGREPPSLSGFEYGDGEWRLDIEYYRPFIEAVTGVRISEDPSTTEIKTVQTRLEGCVETYEREDNCRCTQFHRYDHVDSIEAVHDLTRFFRALVATHIEGTEVVQ